MSRKETSTSCAAAALAAYIGALVSLVRGYAHALGNPCPNHVAPAPVAFWPLLSGAVLFAVIAFALRPSRKDERGERSGADLLAIFVVIAMPLAALGATFGYLIAYGCWD